MRQLSMADMAFSWSRSSRVRRWRCAGPDRSGGRYSPGSIVGRDKDEGRDQAGGLTSVSSTSSGLVTSPIALMATRV